MTGGSRIKVAVRIRPLLDSEHNSGHASTALQCVEEQHVIRIGKEKNGNSPMNAAKLFSFD